MANSPEQCTIYVKGIPKHRDFGHIFRRFARYTKGLVDLDVKFKDKNREEIHYHILEYDSLQNAQKAQLKIFAKPRQFWNRNLFVSWYPFELPEKQTSDFDKCHQYESCASSSSVLTSQQNFGSVHASSCQFSDFTSKDEPFVPFDGLFLPPNDNNLEAHKPVADGIGFTSNICAYLFGDDTLDLSRNLRDILRISDAAFK